MRAPRVILFQGQRYIRAAHERCKPEPGTGYRRHWNEKQQKCLSLPPALRQHVTSAHATSSTARAASTGARMAAQTGSKPETQAKHHQHAVKQHERAAALSLHDAGFKEAAAEHHEHRRTHQAAAAKHEAGQHPEL